jgi:hypothetical protein
MFTSASIPKTPTVTGAWIDTPAPARTQPLADSTTQTKENRQPVGGTSGLSKGSDYNKGKRQALPEPQLPRSALSAIIGRAKSTNTHDVNDDIGDATIQSLEDVMDFEDQNNDVSITEAGIPLPEGMRPTEEDRLVIREIIEQRIAANLPYSEGLPPTTEERDLIREIVNKRMARGIRKRRPAGNSRQSKLRHEFSNDEAEEALTPRRRGRLEEDLQLQRMSEQVSTMHSRTRSLNAGLGRIERQISGASGCRHCGCPGDCYGAHPFSALGRSMKAAIYIKEDGKRRLTWLGWISALCLLWAVLESVMWY